MTQSFYVSPAGKDSADAFVGMNAGIRLSSNIVLCYEPTL